MKKQSEKAAKAAIVRKALDFITFEGQCFCNRAQRERDDARVKLATLMADVDNKKAVYEVYKTLSALYTKLSQIGWPSLKGTAEHLEVLENEIFNAFNQEA